MGLVTLPGTELQYFSFSEEIQAIGSMFFDFVVNISPGWLLFILCISIAFIIIGIFFRMAREIDEVKVT